MKIFKKGFNIYMVLLVISGLIIIGLMGYNIWMFCKQENKEFLKASFIDIATLGIGTYIVFFLSERLNESRRRNDCIEHIITEIENIVCDEKFFSMQRSALMMQASCANKIKYLKDAKFPKIQEEVAFIESKINDIRELYSNHNSSEEDLKSVVKDFEKKRNEINDKCDKIRVLLYT